MRVMLLPRLVGDLRRRERQQRAVAELGLCALRGVRLESLFRAAVAAVAEGLSVEYASVLELEANGTAVVLRAGFGWEQGAEGMVLELQPSNPAARALKRNGPVLVEYPGGDGRGEFLGAHRVASSAVMVILGEDGPFGVLAGHSTRERAFNRNDLFFLRSLANVLAGAVTRERMNASTRQLASIVETSLDAIVGRTPDGIVTSWNAAAERLFGYSAEEMIGRSITILAPPERGGELDSVNERLKRGETVTQFETVRVRKDGTRIEVASTVSPIRDANGEIVAASAISRDISERKRAEEKLRQAEAHYRTLIEQLPLVTYIGSLDVASPKLYVSPQIEHLLGYPAEEWLTDPDLLSKVAHADDRERVLGEAARVRHTGAPIRDEYRCIRPDGRVVWVQDETYLVHDERGEPFVQGYLLDISERKQAEAHLRESEERYRELFENASDMVCSVDESGRFAAINRAGEEITGYASEEIIGMSFEELVAPDDLPRARARFERTMSGGVEAMIEEFAIVRKNGSRATLDVSYSRVETGGERRLELIARDITERKRLEQELRRQAFYDSLTGLANRALFWDRVTHALARRQASAAVLFLDLDDFKNVNDSLGHHTGDRLLAAIGDRLRACARPADTCARLGGDEFALLLEDVRAPGPAIQAAERILTSLEAPIPLPGAEVSVGASIGIALQSSQAEEADELLRNADLAMYSVKARGKNNYALFEPGMLETTQVRLELTAELRRAIEEQQLSLHYQPIVELGSGVITGVEALVRWKHPERGLLSPGDFIPLAEHTGLIIPLSRWVLAEACRQARRWQSAHPYDPPLTVSVNLSARHLQSAELCSDVGGALAESGLAPQSLLLELTESVVADDAGAAEKLSQLRGLGARIALDDFGTGYSSLAYLQRLPIDILKIDRSFVRAMAEGAKEQRVVSMILSLAESLGLSVIAEGIERAEERDQLYALGCRIGQGFLFARPCAPEDTERLLHTRVIETARLRLRLAAGAGGAS